MFDWHLFTNCRNLGNSWIMKKEYDKKGACKAPFLPLCNLINRVDGVIIRNVRFRKFCISSNLPDKLMSHDRNWGIFDL